MVHFSLKDDVCHEMIQNLPYLDQVIHEVLRFYPPAMRWVLCCSIFKTQKCIKHIFSAIYVYRIERQCTKDIFYDNRGIHIKKGVIVTVPAYALHHMEEYYPDPENFDPERYCLLSYSHALRILKLVSNRI